MDRGFFDFGETMGRPLARTLLGLSVALFGISQGHAAKPMYFSSAESRSSPASIDAVMADYARAQSALLAASRHGARAEVTMLVEDGSVHWGHDIFYSAPEPKIEELRDDSTSMQVGDIACTRKRDERRYACRNVGALHLGLFDIDKANIAKVWVRDFACPANDKRVCRFIKVLMHGKNAAENPALIGYDYEVFMDLATHLPIYLRQTSREAIGVEGMAVYQFNFEAKVPQFALPAEASELKSQ